MYLFVQGSDDTTHQPHPQTPIPKTHLVVQVRVPLVVITIPGQPF